MKLKLLSVASVAAFAIAVAARSAAPTGETAIRNLDEVQRRLVASADVAGLERLAHPHLRINAPGNRVLTRKQFLQNMRTGKIAAESFTRTPEDVTISGNLAVVMGRETFTPTAGSELGRTYGAIPLSRRYTNVYVRERGRWWWLARHANVVAGQPPSP